MTLACLVKVSPLNLLAGTRTDVYAASADDSQVTGLNGIVWEPALVSAPTLTMTLWDGDFTGPVSAGGASVPINMNVLKQTYDADGSLWTGAPIEIFAGQIGEAWPWTTRFKGKVTGFSRKDQVLTLTASVDNEPFQSNVLTAVYAGTGGAEGSANIKDRVKPLVLGWASNVEPLLIDELNSVYQFSAYGAIEAVTTLFERGADFGAAMADHATYAALVAASIPAGRWATCLAAGMVRLGAPAAGVITADIKGHKVSTATPRLTGAVISALAGIAGVSSGLIDAASLSALNTAVPYPINVVLTDQTSFADIANTLARCCNCQSGVSLAGTFFISAVNFSGSEVLSLDTSGTLYPEVVRSDELDTSIPYYRTVLGAARSWRVHSADEIAFEARLIERGVYDGATTYRDGDIVSLPDASRWVYTNATPSSGNSPPTWPAMANAWWENLTGPMDFADIIGATKPANNATRNDAGANMLEAPLLMDSGFAGSAGAVREDTGAGGPARDRYRLRLDLNNAFYWLQGYTKIPLITGEKIWLRAWFFAGAGSSGTCQFGLSCDDVAGTFISNVAGPVHYAATGTGWYSLEATIIVPAGVAFGRPYFQRYGGADGGSFYLAEPSITRQQPGADMTSANTAANTAAVGSVPASSVSSTINSGGGVAPNNVDTPAIIANAVTALSYSYTDGTLASGSPSTWTTAQTLTFSATGAPVLINAATLITWTSAGGGFSVAVSGALRIRKNGADILTGPWFAASNGYPDYKILQIVDIPTSGSTVTYTIEVMTTDLSNYTVSKRYLSKLELKNG